MSFFKSGFTTADLNSFGNIPELRVITGARASIHSGNRLDGRLWNGPIDFGVDKIKHLISSMDAGWNNENVGGGLSGIVNGFKSTKGSFERRTLILSTKKNKTDQQKEWMQDLMMMSLNDDKFDWLNATEILNLSSFWTEMKSN